MYVYIYVYMYAHTHTQNILQDEEREVGRVSSKVYWQYINSVGGWRLAASLLIIQMVWQSLQVCTYLLVSRIVCCQCVCMYVWSCIVQHLSFVGDVCMYVCVFVCIHIYIYIYIYIYTHTYIYTYINTYI